MNAGRAHEYRNFLQVVAGEKRFVFQGGGTPRAPEGPKPPEGPTNNPPETPKTPDQLAREYLAALMNAHDTIKSQLQYLKVDRKMDPLPQAVIDAASKAEKALNDLEQKPDVDINKNLQTINGILIAFGGVQAGGQDAGPEKPAPVTLEKGGVPISDASPDQKEAAGKLYDSASEALTKAEKTQKTEDFQIALKGFRESYAIVASPNSHLMILNTLVYLKQDGDKVLAELPALVDEVAKAQEAGRKNPALKIPDYSEVLKGVEWIRSQVKPEAQKAPAGAPNAAPAPDAGKDKDPKYAEIKDKTPGELNVLEIVQLDPKDIVVQYKASWEKFKGFADKDPKYTKNLGADDAGLDKLSKQSAKILAELGKITLPLPPPDNISDPTDPKFEQLALKIDPTQLKYYYWQVNETIRTLTAPSAPEAPAAPAVMRLDAANQLFEANPPDYKGALPGFLEADRVNPNFMTKYKIAKCLAEIGKDSEAIPAYKTFLNSVLEPVNLRQLPGNDGMNKIWDEAIKYLSDHGENVQVFFHGRAEGLANLSPEGQPAAEPSQEVKEKATKIYTEANVKFKAGDFVGALPGFQEADRMNPGAMPKLKIAACLDHGLKEPGALEPNADIQPTPSVQNVIAAYKLFLSSVPANSPEAIQKRVVEANKRIDALSQIEIKKLDEEEGQPASDRMQSESPAFQAERYVTQRFEKYVNPRLQLMSDEKRKDAAIDLDESVFLDAIHRGVDRSEFTVVLQRLETAISKHFGKPQDHYQEGLPHYFDDLVKPPETTDIKDSRLAAEFGRIFDLNEKNPGDLVAGPFIDELNNMPYPNPDFKGPGPWSFDYVDKDGGNKIRFIVHEADKGISGKGGGYVLEMVMSGDAQKKYPKLAQNDKFDLVQVRNSPVDKERRYEDPHLQLIHDTISKVVVDWYADPKNTTLATLPMANFAEALQNIKDPNPVKGVWTIPHGNTIFVVQNDGSGYRMAISSIAENDRDQFRQVAADFDAKKGRPAGGPENQVAKT